MHHTLCGKAPRHRLRSVDYNPRLAPSSLSVFADDSILKRPFEAPPASDFEEHGPEDEDSEAGAEARQSRVRDALVRQAHIDALFTVSVLMYRLANVDTTGPSVYLDTAAVAVSISVFFLSRERYVNGVYNYVAARSVSLVAVRLSLYK